jgi:drug/metabolite transporter (DMT)-like permease
MSASAASLKSTPAALPALLLGGVAIGASPIFVRVSELGPIATAFHRMLWALPFLWLWARMAAGGTGSVRPANRRDARQLLVCGLLFSADLALWHLSIMYTSVANSTLFANFAPVVVTIGAWLVLKERITRHFLVGLVLALTGALMLVGASVQTDHRHVMGDLLGIATAFFYGSYLLTVAGMRPRLSAPMIMFWSSLVTGAALALLAWALGEALLPNTTKGLWILVGLALVAQVAGQGLIAYALGHLPAAFSSLVILIQPVTAALLGWILLGEHIGPLQALGGATILAGILVARRAPGVEAA